MEVTNPFEVMVRLKLSYWKSGVVVSICLYVRSLIDNGILDERSSTLVGWLAWCGSSLIGMVLFVC